MPRAMKTGISILAFRTGDYTPNRLCLRLLREFFHPKRLRWPREGARSASSGHEKGRECLIASDFSDTSPFQPPSFRRFPSPAARSIQSAGAAPRSSAKSPRTPAASDALPLTAASSSVRASPIAHPSSPVAAASWSGTSDRSSSATPAAAKRIPV